VQRRTVASGLVPGDERGARALDAAYWRVVRGASFGLVHVVANDDGVDLRLLRRGPVLLALGAPLVIAGEAGVSVTHAIEGGLLAGGPGGALTLAQSSAARPELSVSVTEFVPRWGRRFYSFVQRPFHIAVSRLFFTRLERGR
jgi:hypothetical protein